MNHTYNELISILNPHNKYFNAMPTKEKGAIFNMFMSDRSDGKTLNCKILSIIDFILYDHAHVYSRRFDTEMSEIMKNTFMSKLIRIYPIIDKWIDYKTDAVGVQAKLKDESEDKYRYMIYFIPISMSGKLKSQIEDERIFDIDFDEYIPLDNKYLKNEMLYVLELYKTCDRDRNVVRFNFFGNKISAFNPFFDFFNIETGINNRKVKMYKNDTIALQIYISNQLKEQRLKSKFTQAVKGTSYDDYNNSGVLLERDLKIDTIKNASFYVSFKTERGEGSIWIKNYHYVVSCKQYGQDIMVVDKMYNTNRECINCLSGNVQQVFKHAYKINELYFESEKAYYLFEPILRKININ